MTLSTEIQPPEGLRQELISAVADRFAASSFHGPFVDIDATPINVVDAVLAALFDACEVREQWGVEAGPRGNRFWGYASRLEALADIAEGLGDGHTEWTLVRRCDLKTPPESSFGPVSASPETGPQEQTQDRN